jgi:hypothetical protein
VLCNGLLRLSLANAISRRRSLVEDDYRADLRGEANVMFTDYHAGAPIAGSVITRKPYVTGRSAVTR